MQWANLGLVAQEVQWKSAVSTMICYKSCCPNSGKEEPRTIKKMKVTQIHLLIHQQHPMNLALSRLRHPKIEKKEANMYHISINCTPFIAIFLLFMQNGPSYTVINMVVAASWWWAWAYGVYLTSQQYVAAAYPFQIIKSRVCFWVLCGAKIWPFQPFNEWNGPPPISVNSLNSRRYLH